MIALVDIAVVSEPAKIFEVAMLVTALSFISSGFSFCVAKSLERMSWLLLSLRSLRALTSRAANWRSVP